uniref:Uncharacterized protein n=1 Tax=Pyxicephalus adspersus TaxID=30357 RepID=A0AAV2ZL51_PYXAD|nr:TPA: hypothetical protein GDO54_005400 [Pyxicephalus adspersus]
MSGLSCTNDLKFWSPLLPQWCWAIVIELWYFQLVSMLSLFILSHIFLLGCLLPKYAWEAFLSSCESDIQFLLQNSNEIHCG